PITKAEGGEALLLAERELCDGDPAGVLEGLGEQPVGLDAGRFGRQVVRLLEIDGIDLIERNEGDDVHGPDAVGGDPLELLVAEDDVPVLLVLVTLDDLVVGNLFLVEGEHPLVADPAVAGGMELVELEALLLDGREQADRDADEAEGDGPVPDGSHGGHDTHDTSPDFGTEAAPRRPSRRRIRRRGAPQGAGYAPGAGSNRRAAKNSRAGLENCPVVVGAAQYDPNHD